MSRSDILALVGVLLSFAALIVSIWGASMRAWLVEKRLKKEFGSDLYLPQDIKNATRYYLRPSATSVDLSQEIEDGNNIIATREQLFKVVTRFLTEESSHRHMLLLADSGMGKSAFVLNYYDYNRRKIFRKHKISVIPLSYEFAYDKILAINNKKDTVLFLDAFDEDPCASTDYAKRLNEIMAASAEFKRVLITSRTQFFPRDAAIPNIARLVIAPKGSDAHHTFWRIYLAPFSDEQVGQYLRRRFKPWSIQKKAIAREIAGKVPKLTVRPMLLLHVPDLLHTPQIAKTTWDIYNVMTEKWYERELGFWKTKEALKQFSEEIAIQFYLSFLQKGIDRVPRERVVHIVSELELVIDEITHWKATSRSLLHRDALGNVKFAHRSIMEFLFLKKFFEGDQRCKGRIWTDLMKQLFAERSRPQKDANYVSPVIGNDISRADLTQTNLSDVDLRDTNLIHSDFIQTNLSRANLAGANLLRCNLREANLTGANLKHANLLSASLIWTKLPDSNLSSAILRNSILIRANLTNADLSDADLSGANLSGANLSGANLSGANLSGANLNGADLSGANLNGAHLPL